MDAASAALLAANRRLHELRERHGTSQPPVDGGRSLANNNQRPPTVDHQPPHTNHKPATCHLPPVTCHSPPATHHLPPPNAYLKLHPDIAVAMLRRGHAADGRLWLLMRYLDREGRGWLRIDLVRYVLTTKNSKMRICGRRQLRNLLTKGSGIFWERDRERVWLRSAARVAMALGVERLAGQPVELPVEVLLTGMGQVRAHFYASFHSGRCIRSGQQDRSYPGKVRHPDRTDPAVSAPISRSRLKTITHIPPRTQRLYERVTGVTAEKNLAVGQRHTTSSVQESAWRHGRGTFTFTDHKGRQGPAGRKYVAWRLPNSYRGPHDPSPKGRQKKINRQIDLVNIGAQGNDLPAGDRRVQSSTVFHPNGLAAGKAYNRNATKDAYWPQRSRRAGRVQTWHLIPAS